MANPLLRKRPSGTLSNRDIIPPLAQARAFSRAAATATACVSDQRDADLRREVSRLRRESQGDNES